MKKTSEEKKTCPFPGGGLVEVRVVDVYRLQGGAMDLGYPRDEMSIIQHKWSDGKPSYINPKDIIACYPCLFETEYSAPRLSGWKLILQGHTEPIYCLESPLDDHAADVPSSEDPYEKAICVLSDNGFGQNLTTVLIACACRNAIDPFEEEEEIMRTPFGVFCDVVADLWVDCEDNTCLCRIADMLVQWVIHHPADYPTSFNELREWYENEEGI